MNYVKIAEEALKQANFILNIEQEEFNSSPTNTQAKNNLSRASAQYADILTEYEGLRAGTLIRPSLKCLKLAEQRALSIWMTIRMRMPESCGAWEQKRLDRLELKYKQISNIIKELYS